MDHAEKSSATQVPTPDPADTVELDMSEQRQLMKKIAFRILPVLMVAYFINSLDKTNISLASLTMDKDLGLTASTFGLASGLFFIGYFVFEIPSNVMLYRVGPRVWITRIMITWGIVSACTAFVSGPTSLYALRVLLGLAEAGFYPGVLLYLTYWFPARFRSRMLAYFVAGGSLSGVFGSPLTGVVLQHGNGFLGLAGWRAMFVIEGTPAVLVGILVLIVMKDRPNDAGWLKPHEKQWLNTALAAEGTTMALERASGVLRMFRDARLVVLAFAYFCKCFGQYALTFFLPQMIVAFEATAHTNYSVLKVSVLTAIPTVLAVAASIPWAMHSDRTGERVWHSAVPMFVATAGICVSGALHQPLGIMAALCVASIGIGTQSQAFFQLPSKFLTGVAAAGGLAMVNAVGNLGGFAAPYVTGWLKDSSGTFSTASYAMGVIMAIGGIVTVLFPRISATTTEVKAHA